MSSYTHFDGTEGRVVVSGYKGVAGDKPRSISFWIRTTQEDLATICWWGDDLTESDVLDGSENRVRLIKGQVELFGKGSGRKSSTAINDDAFHHIVFTWSPRNSVPGHEDFQLAQVYVDSLPDSGKAFGQGKRIIFPDGSEHSTTAVETPEETQVIIGARPVGSGGFTEFFRGDLDEFAVYNDVLSSGAISGAYNSGVRGADLLALGQVPALQFWYRMGDAPGDIAPSGTVPSGVLVDQNLFTSRNAVVSSGVTISG